MWFIVQLYGACDCVHFFSVKHFRIAFFPIRSLLCVTNRWIIIIMWAKKWRNYNSCRSDWVINANKILTCIFPFSHLNTLRMHCIALHFMCNSCTHHIYYHRTALKSVPAHCSLLFAPPFSFNISTIRFVFFSTSYSLSLPLQAKMFSAKLICFHRIQTKCFKQSNKLKLYEFKWMAKQFKSKALTQTILHANR